MSVLWWCLIGWWALIIPAILVIYRDMRKDNLEKALRVSRSYYHNHHPEAQRVAERAYEEGRPFAVAMSCILGLVWPFAIVCFGVVVGSVLLYDVVVLGLSKLEPKIPTIPPPKPVQIFDPEENADKEEFAQEDWVNLTEVANANRTRK